MDFDIATYDVQKYSWYSPHFVIRAMHLLTKLYGVSVEDKHEFQLAREMFDSAAALLGVYELHNDNKYFLQPNLQSESPDVVAAKNIETVDAPVLLEKTNLELVRMEEHADSDDVVEFLRKTKLSSKKSYDNKTLIVCVISKKIQINIRKIADDLRDINPKPKSTIYILGKLQGDKDRWTILSPYPDHVPPVIYSLAETIKKYQLPGSVTMHRGSVKKITYEKMNEQLTTTVYEVFNIDEAKVQKYKIVR